jgi:hypothetical protein
MSGPVTRQRALEKRMDELSTQIEYIQEVLDCWDLCDDPETNQNVLQTLLLEARLLKIESSIKKSNKK